MKTADFNYELPPELIAQYPLKNRADSRLLALDGKTGELQDLQFPDLSSLLRPGDLLVFNNTRVMAARLYGRKVTGGKLELLIERLLDDHRALAHIRASKSPKPGTRILLGEDVEAEIVQRHDALFEVRVPDMSLHELMQRHGHMPLPPYISRSDEALDLERYQTLYSDRLGAVAAPTAGLHFSKEILAELNQQGIETAYVTLHVGAGTFQPVRVDDLDQHVMHSEQVEVSETVCTAVRNTRARGGRVVAVGTTSVRSLEAASASGEIEPFHADTDIFIRPGYPFRSVDALITNFHLPESTLLMLVSAFAGYDNIMAAYRHAIEMHYRFFSYGDAMFLTRRD